MRSDSERAGAAGRPSPPGGCSGGDDPGIAGDRAYDTPAEKRTASIGVWGAAGAFAAAVGPSVGGVVVDALGWRSLFMINVPLGLAQAGLAGAAPRSERKRSRFPDLIGTALLAPGMGLAALGLSQGARWGWSDARTIVALATGVAGAARPITVGVGASDRYPTVEAAHVRVRQRDLAAVRSKPVRMDAARRPRPDTAVALLRAPGRARDDPRSDHGQHRRGPRRPGARADQAADDHRRRRSADGRMRRPDRVDAAAPRRLPRVLAADRAGAG
jgi:hypothetical protein